MFLISLLALTTPITFSESVVDIIRENNKFQHFDERLLELIESGEVTEYKVQIFSSSRSGPTTQQDQVDVITSLLISNYDAQEISHDQNMLGPYVEATVPVDNLPLIANLNFVGIIIASDSPFVQDQSDLSIGEQIRNNPKFEGFFDNLLEAIDNDEIDLLAVSVPVITYSFEKTSEDYIEKRIEQLLKTLEENHNTKRLQKGKADAWFLIPVEELPQLGEYDFVSRIITKGHGWKNLSEDETSGIQKFPLFQHLYDIPFSVKDAYFGGLASYGIGISAEPGGTLLIDAPREIIDQVDIDGYIGFYDFDTGLDLRERFPNLLTIEDKQIDCNYRKMLITFPEGNNATELYGYLMGDTLEFMQLMPIETRQKPAEKYLIDAITDKFTVKVEDGREFDIITRQSGSICNVDFVQQEQKILMSARGKINIDNGIQISIPNSLLSGDFVVSIDKTDVGYELTKSITNNTLSISHYFEKNPIFVEITGSQLLPPPYQLPTVSGDSVNVENSSHSIKYVSTSDVEIKSVQAFYEWTGEKIVQFYTNNDGKLDYKLLDEYKIYLLLSINTADSGVLTITIPKNLVDISKPMRYEHVIVDGSIVQLEDEILAPNSHTISIKIPAKAKQIGIVDRTIKPDGLDLDWENKTTFTSESPPQCFWEGFCPTKEPKNINVIKANSEFEVFSLENIKIVNAFGKQRSSVSQNQMVQVTSEIINNDDKVSSFIFQIQSEQPDGTKTKPKWISGELESGQILSPSLSWIPQIQGQHIITVSAGPSKDTILPKATITVDVTGNTLSEISDGLRGNAMTYSLTHDVKSLIPIVNHFTNTDNEELTKAPTWLSTVSGWWADGLISDEEYSNLINFLVQRGIAE